MTGKQRSLALKYIFAISSSFIFLLFFARYSSPLTPGENGYDAAFFRLVGQRMTEGCLPYRDFFDMKGPCLFLLEYIGQLLVHGRMGAFLLEWINLTAVLLIVLHIFDQLGIQKFTIRILLLLPCLWMAAGTFEGGNMTEELSLPALFLCMDLWLKHYLDRERIGNHAPGYAAVYGAGFMFLVLIRITNAALIGAIVLSLCVELIACRNLKCLLKNAVFFIAGAAVIFLPMYLFYAANGLAGEMLYQVFVFGYKYGSEYSFFSSLSRALKHLHHYFFLLLPFFLLFIYRVRDFRLNLFATFASFFTLFACLPSNQYTHYFTLGIPLIVLGEIMILLNHRNAAQHGKRRRRFAVLLLVISMLFHIQTTGGSVLYSCRLLFIPDFTIETGVEDIASHIDENEKDRVFCYNTAPYFYLSSGINPYIKYCAWHKHYIKLNPEIAAELEMMLKQDPPSCIVTPAKQSLPAFMKELLNTRYHETYRNDQYILHKVNPLPFPAA